MSDAVIRIQVATLSDVPDGQGRIDGVPNQLVTVSSRGSGATHEIQFWDVTNPFVSGSSPIAPVVPTLTPLGDGRTFTFTPPGGASGYGQSFGIELVVDRGLPSEVRSRHKYSIPTQFQGLVLPLFAEGADREAALYNAGTVQVANSADNAAGNWRGYHPRLLRALMQDELYSGRIHMSPNPNSAVQAGGASTTQTRVGALSLPPGSLVEIAADIGDASSGSQQTVFTLKKQSGGSTVATFNVTQLRLWTPEAFAVAIPSETPCEVFINSSAGGGSWVCDGIRFTVRGN